MKGKYIEVVMKKEKWTDQLRNRGVFFDQLHQFVPLLIQKYLKTASEYQIRMKIRMQTKL